MHKAQAPFALPTSLERSLARIFSYWEGLKRAGNEMPFWDDLKPPEVADQADKLVLIDVFAQPERFRFNHVSVDLARRYGEELSKKFLDELALRDPFAYLRAQCSATVESKRPTHYTSAEKPTGASYSRILLPMWGEGQVKMLLGAVEWL